MPEWNDNANDIFLDALDLLDSDQREELIRRRCRGDAALRQDVESLLASYSRANTFLEHPVGVLPQSVIPAAAQKPPGTVGPYEILEQLGEGGMGIVYRAVQHAPIRRFVAVKIIKPGLDSRQIVARFALERQTLALMDHPHIARVLDAGTTDSGSPYFAMELFNGVPMTTFCNQHQLSIERRVGLIVQVCQAVEHAHQKGIIHRDLKPSNVLVSWLDDQPVAKVIDFGVAKALGPQLPKSEYETNPIQPIGTLLYMSPEQLRAGGLDVDTRSDVYALGLLLYEVVTGTHPFSMIASANGRNAADSQSRSNGAPEFPSYRIRSLAARKTAGQKCTTQSDRTSVVPRIRRELDWIAMKAIEEERDRRYASAGALADDLKRFLTNNEVLAGPPSRLYRLRSLARRNRALLLSVFFVALALLAGTVVSTSLAIVAGRERDRAREYAAESRRLLYAGDMRLAAQAWLSNDVRKMRVLLDRHVPSEGMLDLRGFEWYFLRGHAGVQSDTVISQQAPLHCVRRSPNGSRMAAAGADSRISVIDSATGVVVREIPTGQIEINDVAWSPDGSILYSAGDDGTIACWKYPSGERIQQFHVDDEPVFQVLVLDDGKTLATGGRSPKIRLWNLPQGTLRSEIAAATEPIETLAAASGNQIISGAKDQHTILWSTAPLQKVLDFQDLPGGIVNAVAVSASGSLIASGHDNGVLSLRDRVTGHLLAQVQIADAVYSLAFSNPQRPGESNWLAIGDRGGAVSLRSTDDPSQLFRLGTSASEFPWTRQWQAHEGRVYSAAFSADGEQLWTAGQDGRLKRWKLDTARTSRLLSLDAYGMNPADGENIAVREPGLISLLDSHGNRLWSQPIEHSTQTAIKSLPALKAILYTESPTRLRLRALPGGGDLDRQWDVPIGRVIDSVEASVDGKHVVAVVKLDTIARDIRVLTNPETKPIDLQSVVHCLRMTDDGRFIIYDQIDEIHVVEVATTRLVRVLRGHQTSIWRMAISPDQKYLASVSRDRTIRIWELATGREVWSELGHANESDTVCFSPDGETIATTGADGLLRLWRWRQGSLVFEYPLLDMPASDLAFSADGKKLFVRGAKQKLRVYDAGPSN